ncbi:MAG: hypothetical protein KBS84_01455, partial [Treponema sp.]|nr:hypothetical protein [Candidatus Treponema scatequi]
CRLYSVSINQCTMQKVKFEKSIVCNSNFKDFEAINSHITNTVFYNCRFENTMEFGMNGFSGGIFENCIFCNCIFNGYPLRGSELHNCIFTNCFGEISDDSECDNTIGLQHFNSNVSEMQLAKKEQAEQLINEWK